MLFPITFVLFDVFFLCWFAGSTGSLCGFELLEAWKFVPDVHGPNLTDTTCNVGITINQTFWNGFYHLFMVTFGVVYCYGLLTRCVKHV